MTLRIGRVVVDYLGVLCARILASPIAERYLRAVCEPVVFRPRPEVALGLRNVPREAREFEVGRIFFYVLDALYDFVGNLANDALLLQVERCGESRSLAPASRDVLGEGLVEAR